MLEFIERTIGLYGLPTVIIIFLGWFVATKWFPWWANQQEAVMRELIQAINALRDESRATAEILRTLAHRVEQLERSIEKKKKEESKKRGVKHE